MLNTTTNLYVLIIFAVTLIFEMFITKLLDVSMVLPWGLTIAVYFIFIISQILMKMNEESEKHRVRELLIELLDATNGLPVMNKNEKLIIKWDIVFKKLIENKEFIVYDKIQKLTTPYIDGYVNKYPSLLMNDSIDLRESKSKIDLNSTIRGKKKNNNDGEKQDLITDEDENKKKLFIRDIKGDTASFSNYNSAIYINVIIKNEYIPENADELNIPADPNYSGFSVWMIYKDVKYNIVPRVTVYKKLIDKQQWMLDHLDDLLTVGTAIVNGDTAQVLPADEFMLMEYLSDMPSEKNKESFLQFKHLNNDILVFAGISPENKSIQAYCSFKTGYNRFEVILKYVEYKANDMVQRVELEKTVAMGNSFQPLVTMLEKMPQLIKNIELVISNKDINSIVIS